MSTRASSSNPLALACICLFIALSALVGFPATAAAQDSSIKGTLEEVDNADRTPVEGAVIVVAQDGTEIGSATSAADGTWEVSVPAAGTYQVTLDADTLPDGVVPTDPDRTSLDGVDVRDGQGKTVRFNLGPGISSNVGDFERLTDLTVLGLKLGAIIALAAVGLSLIFGVTDLVNFAHGEMITLGAVLAYFFNAAGAGPGWPLLVAVIPAVVLSGVAAMAQEKFLWRPLRVRRAGSVAILVISIGLSFAMINIVLVILGGAPTNYTDYVIQSERSFLGIDTVPKNVFIVLITVVMLGAVGLFLQRTQAGVAVRAVADNKDLAESSGIDVNRVIMITWLLGGALTGLSGVFLGVSEKVQWDMGFKILLLVFAAVVLGGLGTAYGAMLGGFVVGLAVELSTFWIATELKNAVALGVLIVMLLWRPQGLLGTKDRIG